MKFTASVLAFLMVSIVAQASVKISQEAKVVDPNHAGLKVLSQNPEIIIDHVNSLGYEVYGADGLDAYLGSLNLRFVKVNRGALAKIANNYLTPEQSTQAVLALAQKYPTLITTTEIGKSVEGRSLTFARVTAPDGQGTPLANRPEFKYIANMHGDEIVGRDMMVKLIEDLASNYGKDPRITNILNTTQVYILQSMNPDGAAHQVRENSHGTDLNRSFPDFTTTDTTNTPDGREPEIQAVMKFEAEHHFKLSANFHGGAEVVNYPYDCQAQLFPLDSLAERLSLDYAKRAPYIYNSTEFKNGITNGFAWYQVQGGMQDWSYHWYNDLQFTIEVTEVKWPAFSTVNSTYQANRDSLLAFIEDTFQF
jgi:hypothetical protein